MRRQFGPSRRPQKLSVASLIANQGVVISIPTRPDPYFREDLSSNIFYGLSSPASDFRRAAKVCVTLKSNLAVVRSTDSLHMITAVERDV